MPRAKSEGLTVAEQRVMEVLWSSGSGTVGEVAAAIQAPKPLAFNTVQTILRILEQKGYARHTEEGRAFRYHPAVDRRTVSRSAVQNVVRRFFGSPGKLALNLIESDRITPEEIAHIRRLLDRAERRK